MVWQPELDELRRRRELAKQMGGEAGIAKQHRRGKLTIRERLDRLTDEGSFQEIGGLAGVATYEGNELVDFRPSNMVIGLARLNGRRVVLNGGDFTVRGGASDASVGNKGGHAQKLALGWRLPYVRLLDSTGGSVKTFEQIGRTYIPTNPVTPSRSAGVTVSHRRGVQHRRDHGSSGDQAADAVRVHRHRPGGARAPAGAESDAVHAMNPSPRLREANPQ